MSFDTLGEFLAMGGYATYVWSSYAAFAVVIAANVMIPLARGRRVRERLERELSYQERRQ